MTSEAVDASIPSFSNITFFIGNLEAVTFGRGAKLSIPIYLAIMGKKMFQ